MKTPVRFAAIAAVVALGLAAPAFAQSRLAPPAGTPMATAHLNPNTATEAQLRALPQVSAELRAALLRSRPFANPAAFQAVVGATTPAAAQAAVYAAVWLPLNLNTASRDEMMHIPGMSTRMTREFEEYRPYRDMDQFRREIGKYVDAGEVARLESYVTLR